MEEFEKVFGLKRVKQNKDITHYFTIRTVATAEFYMEAETTLDLLNAVSITKKMKMPLFILGGGSNVAVTHSLIKGLVVRNLYQKKQVINETEVYVDLLVSSGYSISRLAMETAKEGYEGLEYHFGLPGTVGGAVAMNSKWVGRKNRTEKTELAHLSSMDDIENFPKYIGDQLQSAIIIDKNGVEKNVDQDYFAFAYDYSILQDTKEIFIEGIFRLNKRNSELLVQRSKDAQEFRKITQLTGMSTCGCIFQNISEKEKIQHKLPTASAGYLIDKAGMKNVQVGEFIVSDIHANFIVNKGTGKPEDLLQLIEKIKARVKQTFDIELVEEVKIL